MNAAKAKKPAPRRRSFKVPVALTEYTVTLHPTPMPDPDDPTDEIQGITKFPERTIEMHTQQSESGLVLTFWHEWLHAVLHELGYPKLCHNENLVEGLSQHLVRAIQAVPNRFKDKQ